MRACVLSARPKLIVCLPQRPTARSAISRICSESLDAREMDGAVSDPVVNRKRNDPATIYPT